MLFSAHIADTTPLSALRRATPAPGEVPGLRSARTAIAAPFTGGAPRPQFGREIMLAAWEDAAALEKFLERDDLGRQLGDGVTVRLELVRAVGIFPGLTRHQIDKALDGVDEHVDGPSVAITLGTAYLRTFPTFFRVNTGLERQFLATPSGRWGTAMSNLRTRFVATLTVWDSLDAASSYMKEGAHGAAMRAHFDPEKDPNGHEFVTDGGFLGFRPLSIDGRIGGRNPLDVDVLSTS